MATQRYYEGNHAAWREPGKFKQSPADSARKDSARRAAGLIQAKPKHIAQRFELRSHHAERPKLRQPLTLTG